MQTKIFFVLLIAQIMTAFAGILRRDRELVYFALFSAVITLLLVVFLEFGIHHILRIDYGIPNVVVYSALFLVLLAYQLRFRKLGGRRYYLVFIAAVILWGASAITDLLRDAGIKKYLTSNGVEEITGAAGTLMFLGYYFLVFLKKFKPARQTKPGSAEMHL